jgi:uncharacterized protein
MHRVLNLSTPRVTPGLCAVGIMTKAPRAGAVKTRLQPPLTPEEAAALNFCFLRDTADAISRSGDGVRGVGIYTPLGSEEDYSGILPRAFDLLPQRGNDFGERLTRAVEDLLRAGFDSCCLIDSDSPTVTSDVYRAAAEFLREDDDRLVIGPSDDGGYYLIGMRKLHRRLFEQIEWSTERVFVQTMERAGELRLRVQRLPIFFDVDDRASLHCLCSELLGANSSSAPATKAFLRELIAREGRERIWPQ